MRPLATLLVPEFIETYHVPVADLGVTQVRFTTDQAGDIDELFFRVPWDHDTPKSRVVELARRLLSLWSEMPIAIIGSHGSALWDSGLSERLAKKFGMKLGDLWKVPEEMVAGL